MPPPAPRTGDWQYDKDGDGRIDLTEMHALLSDVHEKVSADEVKRWMDKLDPDKSVCRAGARTPDYIERRA